MFTVIGYATGCPWCDKAKHLLSRHGKTYTYLEVEGDDGLRKFLKAIGKRTVPQIFEGTRYVGGYEDLKEHLENADNASA